MVVGSARPMEDTARISRTELYVGNMVDTAYSLVARDLQRYLP